MPDVPNSSLRSTSVDGCRRRRDISADRLVTTQLYFTGALPNYQVPRYTRWDMNVAWRALENFELSVTAQNLLGRHMEFGSDQGPANAISRNIYAKLTWRF